MSYDLYFDLAQPTSCADIQRHFRERSHYQVSDGAVYQNANTGVYFQFNWSRDSAQALVSHVAFNMNYFRPHVFGLEAEPEVRAFVARFSPKIEDPQLHGMGSGPYASDRFLSGWNAGNEAAYEAILQMQHPTRKLYTLPSAVLERIWRWNSLIGQTQAKFGESLFVPKVMLLAVNGELTTVVVWGDAIPELIPDVQAVLVVRDELSPDSVKNKSAKDRCLVQQRTLDDVLAPLLESGYPLPVRFPSYNEPPAAVRTFIKSLVPASDHIAGIAFDGVLDWELVSKYSHDL
ncbi:hypothetical protein C0Z16_34565 [Paraburkholderia rhynchosiae]|uniref:Uncharacterized protein n=1 Tax=Paraburkholderia rhynchosiae TaxID=487049 RepID=A0ABX4UU47_9BURK|nr:hypothetical protein [Paraburkholderia rhynchosiae]PMS20516.1 hypothetical protein C0Z16_34565 [Paraburkholderia rhynchosiae]